MGRLVIIDQRKVAAPEHHRYRNSELWNFWHEQSLVNTQHFVLSNHHHGSLSYCPSIFPTRLGFGLLCPRNNRRSVNIPHLFVFVTHSSRTPRLRCWLSRARRRQLPHAQVFPLVSYSFRVFDFSSFSDVVSLIIALYAIKASYLSRVALLKPADFELAHCKLNSDYPIHLRLAQSGNSCSPR